MTRVEPCACGGRIVAIEGEEALAVASHNATREHLAWREAGGMEALVHGEAHEPRSAPALAQEPADARPALTWEPAAPRQALAAALASQDVVEPSPAPWRYAGGRSPELVIDGPAAVVHSVDEASRGAFHKVDPIGGEAPSADAERPPTMVGLSKAPTEHRRSPVTLPQPIAVALAGYPRVSTGAR